MEWIAEFWTELREWLPAVLPVLGIAIDVATIIWILMTKPDATAAVAWCLCVLFLPFLGALLFVLFGYQHVRRPLKNKILHKQLYRVSLDVGGDQSARWLIAKPPSTTPVAEETPLEALRRLADHVGALPNSAGNAVDLYHEGNAAFEAIFQAIAEAKHHVHLEFFIFQPDDLGRKMIDVLAAKARQGVEVRLLYDAMGSHRLRQKLLKPLHDAGGQTSVFLPINILRRRIQINMRNHRKILIADGQVGFTGGLNVGNEYLGLNEVFGFWRDTHLRLRGPAVGSLQRVFCEDWDYAAEERLGEKYFPPIEKQGPYDVQVIDSGPDRDVKGIREVYFASILKAKKRIWIATPYFVPDLAILDALRLAAYMGVDVRLLCQLHPDKWLPQWAAQFYWTDILDAGVKVYQYSRGMMHAKVVIVDHDWSSVGSANLDKRSLFLNFEANCLIYHREINAQLAGQFEEDFRCSIKLDAKVYNNRPISVRLLENGARLFSPVL